MSPERYHLPTLGLVLAVVGSFMFLLGLFVGPFLPYQTGGGLWFWPLGSLTAPVTFYFGIGLVIIGTVLFSAAGGMVEKAIAGASRTEDQKLSKKTRMRHLPIDLGIALMAGVVGAAVNNFVAWAPSFGSHGFPFTVTTISPGCFGPGGSIGCVAYYPLGIALDGAFWACLALVTVTVADFVTTVQARTRLTSVAMRKINQ